MATLKLEIVTAESAVYSDDVDVVVVPGVEGQLGILPRHAPLMTMIQPGELLIRKGSEEIVMAVSGGFLEVMGDHVMVLADTAERADEIDIARAEEALRRAEERLRQRTTDEIDLARAEAAMRRSLMRLRVAEKHRRRTPGAPISRQTESNLQ